MHKRRLEFGLRALLATIALIGPPAVWAANIELWIQRRHEFLSEHATSSRASGSYPSYPDKKTSGVLWLFGETTVFAWVTNGMSEADITEAETLFPESKFFENPRSGDEAVFQGTPLNREELSQASFAEERPRND